MTHSVNGLVNTSKTLEFVMVISGKDCNGRVNFNNIFICLQISDRVQIIYSLSRSFCSNVKATSRDNYSCMLIILFNDMNLS